MSILDDLLGNTSANASNSAAADTFGKQTAATGRIRAAGSDYASGMGELSKKFDPYVSAGSDALKRLLAGLGLGGGGEDFTAAVHALPGFQSGLDTGTKATAAALNAGNVGQSGKALKSLYRFGSDYESGRTGDYLARLLGLTGVGQSATGQQVSTAGEGLCGELGAETSAYGGDMTAAGTIGQGQVAGANAKQSAIGNLLNTAAYLGGSALGGGRLSSFTGTQIAPSPPSPYGYSSAYPQIPLYGPGR